MTPHRWTVEVEEIPGQLVVSIIVRDPVRGISERRLRLGQWIHVAVAYEEDARCCIFFNGEIGTGRPDMKRES